MKGQNKTKKQLVVEFSRGIRPDCIQTLYGDTLDGNSEGGDINRVQNKANDIELGYALQLERVYALRTQNLMQQQGKDNK